MSTFGLPIVRPGEIGQRWFGKANAAAYPKTVVEVKLVMFLPGESEPITITHNGTPVKMKFKGISPASEAALVEDDLVGATRDEVGDMVIDWKDCD